MFAFPQELGLGPPLRPPQEQEVKALFFLLGVVQLGWVLCISIGLSLGI